MAIHKCGFPAVVPYRKVSTPANQKLHPLSCRHSLTVVQIAWQLKVLHDSSISRTLFWHIYTTPREWEIGGSVHSTDGSHHSYQRIVESHATSFLCSGSEQECNEGTLVKKFYKHLYLCTYHRKQLCLWAIRQIATATPPMMWFGPKVWYWIRMRTKLILGLCHVLRWLRFQLAHSETSVSRIPCFCF